MALQAPIERSTHSVLRAAVLELIETEPRRQFPAALHAGVPGRGVRHVDADAIDAGLRADIALTLMRCAGAVTASPHVWLTRPGELSVHDDDLRWLGPVAWAAGALGLGTRLVVVTRRGWFDPVSGVRREWRRLRRRSSG
jgi:hypothetical protein